MKKSIFIIFLVLININCIAQQKTNPINTGKGYNGEEINYLSSKTFNRATINDRANLNEIIRSKSLEKIIALLGKPSDIKIEQDKANNGTILFERKLVTYPGLLLVFPQKDTGYSLSRIDFTSDRSTLNINGQKISVGLLIERISTSSLKNKSTTSGGNLEVYISEDHENGDPKKTNAGNLQLRKELIRIKYSSSKKVEGISILIYTI